jgi:general secretion pathway protein C
VGDLPGRVRGFVAPGGAAASGLKAQGPQALVLVGAALLAAQLGLLVWHFVPGAHKKAIVPTSAVPVHARADVNEILAAHLFGSAEVAPVSGEDAPRTRVALILAGTLAVSDPTQGLAIVGETAQSGRLYAVGAMLPGGVKLHEVYTDRVVLDRDGNLETLPMPRQLNGGKGAVAMSPPATVGEPGIAENVQKLIAQGPEVIGEILRPMPMYAGGQLKGFRVFAGRDRTKFAKLGLHAGDVVTQINGVPLSDAQRGMEILRGLGNGGSAQVTIERGGATTQLTIDASQLGGLAQPTAESAAPEPPPPANNE